MGQTLNNLHNKIFIAYKEHSYIDQLKAKLIFYLAVIAFIGVSFLILNLLFILKNYNYLMVFTLSGGNIAILLVIYLLYKGQLNKSMYIFLSLPFFLQWLGMFAEANAINAKPIFVTDTISFMYAQLVFVGFLLHSKKKLVLTLYIMNIVILIFFTIHIQKLFSLEEVFFWEYMLDNLLPILFIYGLTYTLSLINTIALNRANNEININKELNETLEQRVQERTQELQDALENVKVLNTLLPMCSVCRKVRNDEGYWDELETYISDHTDSEFSHGICNDCMKTQYPEAYEEMKKQGKIK